MILPWDFVSKVLFATHLLVFAQLFSASAAETKTNHAGSNASFWPKRIPSPPPQSMLTPPPPPPPESSFQSLPPSSHSTQYSPPSPPSPPSSQNPKNIHNIDDNDIPARFIRAEKGDLKVARSRYVETLAWRAQHKIDTILSEPLPHFPLIKQNYHHYHHLRGYNNELCYYEIPGKTNLAALRQGGLSIDDLLRYYALVCEFTWEVLANSDENAQSIYIMDLVGMKPWDFAGEVVDFVKRASVFTRDHYPERLAALFVVNVPAWFGVVWKVVQPIMDDNTRSKMFIFSKGDKKRLLRALESKIPRGNIPPEYGGDSMPLGKSPEEQLFANLMARNNAIASGCWSDSA